MARSLKVLIPMLVAGLLVTGCANTLLTKFQDMQCVRNCESSDPKERESFEQPVLQTIQMFIGEGISWVVILIYYIYRMIAARSTEAPVLYRPVNQEEDDSEDTRSLSAQQMASPLLKPFLPSVDDRTPLLGWKIWLLAIPACCDIVGTTLMNCGFLFVGASIYQMIRGALVLFVGLFSVLFLKRKLYGYHWFSLVCVVSGVALVGVAGALFPGDKNPAADTGDKPELVRAVFLTARAAIASAAEPSVILQTVFGIMLIAFAQIFTATQFCVEEWILEHYALDPLKVTAWEGTFGLFFTCLGQLILHFTFGVSESGRHGYFDAKDGYEQMFYNKNILLSSILIMFSICGFSFCGLSVTRTVSATARSIVDTCRTLFIWIVSLALGWESFKWLQVLGFALLVYGTFLFNELIRPPIRALMRPEQAPKPAPYGLHAEDPVEHP